MSPFELDARDAWNAGASGFVHFVESGLDYYRHLVHGPALLEACGDVAGLTALDLGCGQGYFSRLLAEARATVTGVDLSDRLIARARELEHAAPLGITYHVLDATRLDTHFPHAHFDLVTGCMSLQDMADPAAVFAGTRRVLRGRGRTVFSIPHPCTDPPTREWQRDAEGRKLVLCLDRYFETGPALCHWNMKRVPSPWTTPYHRLTLTQWSDLIRDAGFVIRRLVEPRPDAKLVATHPELEDCYRMPYFLIFDLVGGSACA
jgi:ubiquinone/menaquinone biosynthesis C-methylase UbiE